MIMHKPVNGAQKCTEKNIWRHDCQQLGLANSQIARLISASHYSDEALSFVTLCSVHVVWVSNEGRERAVSCWDLPNTSCDMMFDGVKNKIEQVQEIYGPLKVSINLLIVNHAFFIYYERFTANKLASWWWQAWTWGKLDITCCKISFNFPNIDFIWVMTCRDY